MSETFRKRFLDKVCPWDSVLTVLFGVNMAMLVMLGLAVLVGPQDEGTMVITGLALAFILVSLAIVVPLLRLCQTREPDE